MSDLKNTLQLYRNHIFPGKFYSLGKMQYNRLFKSQKYNKLQNNVLKKNTNIVLLVYLWELSKLFCLCEFWLFHVWYGIHYTHQIRYNAEELNDFNRNVCPFSIICSLMILILHTNEAALMYLYVTCDVVK